MTPYGTCGHTHYEGGPPCIHSAYQRGFEEGQHWQAVNEMVVEPAQFTAAGSRSSSPAIDFERSSSAAGRTHDPLCPSHYTFTACECPLIHKVRRDEAMKSQSADIAANVSENRHE